MEQIILIFAAVVAAANIITEVAKNVIDFGGTKRINAFVLVLSIILSVAAYSAYFTISGYAFTWYAVAAFIVGGILASYAAMFGFDKLLTYIEDIFSNIKEAEE